MFFLPVSIASKTLISLVGGMSICPAEREVSPLEVIGMVRACCCCGCCACCCCCGWNIMIWKDDWYRAELQNNRDVCEIQFQKRKKCEDFCETMMGETQSSNTTTDRKKKKKIIDVRQSCHPSGIPPPYGIIPLLLASASSSSSIIFCFFLSLCMNKCTCKVAADVPWQSLPF